VQDLSGRLGEHLAVPWIPPFGWNPVPCLALGLAFLLGRHSSVQRTEQWRVAEARLSVRNR